MDERFSWEYMDNFHVAEYYNDIDLAEDRLFVIVDIIKKQKYIFPKFKKEICGEKILKTMIIEKDLWNQEFFNWICSTSPDFCVNIPEEFLTPELIEICLDNSSKPEFLKEVPNLNGYQYEKFVKRFPQAVIYLPEKYKSEKWAKEVLNEFPELLIHFPLNSVDDIIRSNCYAKVSFENKILLIAKGYMNSKEVGTLLSRQTLMYLIDECLSLKKSLLKTIPWNKIPEYLLTEDISLKLVQNDATCITIIPIKFYEIAVKNNALALKFISDKYKTYFMCLDAVTFYSSLINDVPANILNRHFLSDLQTRKVVTPNKSIPYINECLKLNEQFYGIINSNQDDELKQAYNEIPSEIRNISINNLHVFFSAPALEQITKLGITNLGELFVQSKTIEFISYFECLKVYNEVINTISLLRCKYLNEKPVVDINDAKFNEDDEHDFYVMLGLSKRSIMALSRKKFCNSSKEFFLKMQLFNIEHDLMTIRYLGEKGKNEIIAKANIVINYYQASQENIINYENEFNDTDLDELFKELYELRQEKSKIDAQIDIVLAKIEEKSKNNNKGGVQLLQLNPKKP